MMRQKVKGVTIRLRHDGVLQSLRFFLDTCRPGRQIVLQLDGNRSRTKTAPGGITILSGVEHLQRLRNGQLPEAFYRDEDASGRRCFVARCDDELAGVLWVFDEKHPSNFLDLKHHEAEFGNGHVLNRFRRRGVFRHLICEACSALSAEGYSSFYAIVDERNAASLRALETAGFRHVGGLSRPLANLFGVKFHAASQPGAYPPRETSQQAPAIGDSSSPGLGPSGAPGACPLTFEADLEGCDVNFRREWQPLLAGARWPHYQQSYEAGLLKLKDGWSVAFVCLKSEEKVMAGAQIATKQVAWGFSAIAVIPSGPLWLPGCEALLPKLYEAVRAHCCRRRTIFCRINVRCPADQFPEVASGLPPGSRTLSQKWTYWNMPRANMHLDISGGVEEVLRKMHRSARGAYQSGMKRGVRLYPGGREHVPELVRLLQGMAERKNLYVRSEQYFHTLFDTHSAESTRLTVAEADGSIIGAALAVACGRTAYLLYAAFDYEKRLLNPSVGLQVETIRWAVQQGCTVFDMGGTCTDWPPDPRDKGYGVFQFKSRLGAQPVFDGPYCDLVFRRTLYLLAMFAENAVAPLIMEKGWGKLRVAGERIRLELLSKRTSRNAIDAPAFPAWNAGGRPEAGPPDAPPTAAAIPGNVKGGNDKRVAERAPAKRWGVSRKGKIATGASNPRFLSPGCAPFFQGPFRQALAETDSAFRQQWNRFVAEAEYDHIQQSYEHGLLRSRAGWNADFFWLEQSGRIVAGAVMLRKAIRLTGRSVAEIPGGPSWLPGHRKSIRPLLRHVTEFCRQNGVVFCRMHSAGLAQDFGGVVSLLPEPYRVFRQVWTYWNLPRSIMRMSISAPLESLIQAMHPAARRNYRQARTRGLRVRRCGRDQLTELAKLMHAMGQRKGLLVREAEHYRALFDAYPPERISLFLAEADNEICGAGLAVVHGKTVWGLYQAVDYAKRSLHPSEALEFAAIEWAQELGCTTYDLGGTCTNWSPHETDKGYGVWAFKRRLGAASQLLAPYCDLIARPLLYRVGRFLEEVAMPLVIEKGMGKFQVVRERLIAEREQAEY
jgi:lipid II:glycine glycyltransferase (peptidoglycan interpeptide bridge formation enzyme)/ribosomal protein S18 acetylase RimI-like enzyme